LHADDCSGVILDALWQSVRQQAAPAATRALDEQFQRVEAIKIDYAGLNFIRISDAIARIQAQIDQQAAPASGSPLRLTVSGDPDLNCYTRADFVGDPAPLDLLLNWLSWRNGFTVRHDPPNVELVFHEKCCWGTPPTHFATSSNRP
jgi:hypothetical protein